VCRAPWPASGGCRLPAPRLVFYVLLAALGFAATAASGAESTVGEDGVATLKAAFVLNFARYTEWPASSFHDQGAIEVRVLGDRRAAQALEDLAQRAAPIAGRRLAVRYVEPELDATPGWRRLIADLRSSQVLYIGGSLGAGQVPRLLAELAGTDVLTVGDVDGFAAAGGMLGLVIEQNRIAFDANPSAIAASRLRVSARVLKLARHLAGETR
jgi:hypothetical protein